MVTLSVPKIWIITSLLLCLGVAITSVRGLLVADTYSQETANWALQAKGQDGGNLVALIFFLSSLYVVKRKPWAYFVWIGSLLYFVYAYLVYAFFIHFNPMFLLYVSVLGLSAYTLIGGLLHSDSETIKVFFDSKDNHRIAKVLLVAIGVTFSALWLTEIMTSLSSGALPKSLVDSGLWVNPIQIIDLSLVLPGMIITSKLLNSRHWLGYLFLGPWLIFSVLMGTSIVITMMMLMVNGDMSAVVPTILVGTLVGLSVWQSFNVLGKIRRL